MTSTQLFDNDVLCPQCGTRFDLDGYANLIELGIDGIRDQCRVCGAISMIRFSPGEAGKTAAEATLED